jgi:hypothetical protein
LLKYPGLNKQISHNKTAQRQAPGMSLECARNGQAAPGGRQSERRRAGARKRHCAPVSFDAPGQAIRCAAAIRGDAAARGSQQLTGATGRWPLFAVTRLRAEGPQAQDAPVSP